MRILACYKCVPDEQDITVNTDKTLNFKSAEFKVGAYDLNAVEAAMKISEVNGAEIFVLTAGDENIDNSKLKKSILSRGPAAMYGIMDASLSNADSYATAKVLKAGVDKIGAVDLIICGEGSGDMYSQQTGPMLGALLGWNTVNAVCALTIDGNMLKVERRLDDGVEVLEVDLPAVISVSSDINTPRIAGMKDILAAGKKPSTIWSLAESGADASNGVEVVSILAPEQAERKKVIIEGDGDAEIEELFAHMRKLV